MPDTPLAQDRFIAAANEWGDGEVSGGVLND